MWERLISPIVVSCLDRKMPLVSASDISSLCNCTDWLMSDLVTIFSWSSGIVFLYSATLKSAGFCLIPAVQKFAFGCFDEFLYVSLQGRETYCFSPGIRLSVRPSVCLSVTNRVRSITWKPLKLYSRNLIQISISMRWRAECKNGNSAFYTFWVISLGTLSITKFCHSCVRSIT